MTTASIRIATKICFNPLPSQTKEEIAQSLIKTKAEKFQSTSFTNKGRNRKR
ncbi:hypothetical protein LEP1GSC021_0107 [Leptospira noguchii str. 1993005606]|nr:hypothetical protein LEP1GSC021_0107 [Leptospira noguchii str. 1993005606]